MGLLLTATSLLMVACFALGGKVDIVFESEPWAEEDIAPHTLQAEEKLFYPNPCTSKKTCGDCISEHPDCAWCALQSMDYRDYRKERCNYADVIRRECGPRYTVNPKNKGHKINDHLWNLYLRPKSQMRFGFTAHVKNDIRVLAYTVDNAPDNVQISYLFQCSGYEPESKSFCRYAKKGDRVEVKVLFKLLSCPKNRHQYNQTMRILGGDLEDMESWNDVVKVNLHMICECDKRRP